MAGVLVAEHDQARRNPNHQEDPAEWVARPVGGDHGSNQRERDCPQRLEGHPGEDRTQRVVVQGPVDERQDPQGHAQPTDRPHQPDASAWQHPARVGGTLADRARPILPDLGSVHDPPVHARRTQLVPDPWMLQGDRPGIVTDFSPSTYPTGLRYRPSNVKAPQRRATRSNPRRVVASTRPRPASSATGPRRGVADRLPGARTDLASVRAAAAGGRRNLADVLLVAPQEQAEQAREVLARVGLDPDANGWPPLLGR
jgi:hypothetical protein